MPKPKEATIPETKQFYTPQVGMNPILSPNMPSAAAVGGQVAFGDLGNTLGQNPLHAKSLNFMA
jgi:hypothetical protein